MYYPKDFIETAEGFVFAVVAEGTEDGKVLGFLRYVQTESGWKKLATEQSNDFLARHHPHYLYYSSARDAHLHAVAIHQIKQHHQPRRRLQQLLANPSGDPVIEDLLQLIQLFRQQDLDISAIGVTGSVLIGAQKGRSDLDLVIYERNSFYKAREIIQILFDQNSLQRLNESDWLEAYQRRDCDLSFEEYVWHEHRKLNKAIINGRKVDIGLLLANSVETGAHFNKRGFIVKTCKVLDAGLSFDYPAEFTVDAEEFEKVVCFTATYHGQALAGELIQVAGHLEVSEDGERRVVVGSTREARGEYIKVIN